MSLISSQPKRKIYSNHILYASIFGKSKDSFRQYVVNLILISQKAIKKLEPEYNTKCYANVVVPVNIHGVGYGFSYVWITCSKVFNVILGRNPDGSIRDELIDFDLDNTTISSSWADMVDEENKRPRRLLPSLIVIEPLKLTREEIQLTDKLSLVYGLMGTIDKTTGLVNPAFRASHVKAFGDDDDYSNDDLIARSPLPVWYTIEMLSTEISRYCTSGQAKVIITSSGLPIIKYSPGNFDGLFAYQMIRILKVFKTRHPDGPSAVIIFDHARKTTKTYH